jgi:hypothetical protein
MSRTADSTIVVASEELISITSLVRGMSRENLPVIVYKNYINKAALCPRSEDVAHINADM